MDAPRRRAMMECVASEGVIFYVNLMQLQEIPQNAMSRLKRNHFTMGSVSVVSYEDATLWGSRYNM